LAPPRSAGSARRRRRRGGRREALGVVAVAEPFEFVLGDGLDLTVVGNERVDVVAEHRRKGDIALLGDLTECLERVLVDAERDGLVLVAHRLTEVSVANALNRSSDDVGAVWDGRCRGGR